MLHSFGFAWCKDWEMPLGLLQGHPTDSLTHSLTYPPFTQVSGLLTPPLAFLIVEEVWVNR